MSWAIAILLGNMMLPQCDLKVLLAELENLTHAVLSPPEPSSFCVFSPRSSKNERLLQSKNHLVYPWSIVDSGSTSLIEGNRS